jgi:serine/threonine protein kinase
MSDKYTFFENKILGEGLTSIVCEGICNETNEKVAVKIINKFNKIRNFERYISNEIKILKYLNCIPTQNIIKLLDVFENVQSYILIFEYSSINFNEIINNIPHSKILFYVKQLLDILILLKNNNIIHNDIKPANILISNDIIKLCDFGMAEFLEKNQNSIKGQVCGSPIYMDLQKLDGIHSYESDFWSFKLIYYQMVYRQHPFNDVKKKEDLKIKLEKTKKNLFETILFYVEDNPHTKILKLLFSNKIKSPNELLDYINTILLDNNYLINFDDKIFYEDEKIDNSNISMIHISRDIFDMDEIEEFILI